MWQSEHQAKCLHILIVRWVIFLKKKIYSEEWSRALKNCPRSPRFASFPAPGSGSGAASRLLASLPNAGPRWDGAMACQQDAAPFERPPRHLPCCGARGLRNRWWISKKPARPSGEVRVAPGFPEGVFTADSSLRWGFLKIALNKMPRNLNGSAVRGGGLSPG